MSDYTNLDFETVLEIDAITYKILFRDAYVHMLSQTDEGKEYLEKCWLLTQSEPDRKALREQFNKE